VKVTASFPFTFPYDATSRQGLQTILVALWHCWRSRVEEDKWICRLQEETLICRLQKVKKRCWVEKGEWSGVLGSVDVLGCSVVS